MYSIKAQLMSGKQLIGYRLESDNGEVKHYDVENTKQLSLKGLIHNARVESGNLIGRNIHLDELEQIQVKIKGREEVQEEVQEEVSEEKEEVQEEVREEEVKEEVKPVRRTRAKKAMQSEKEVIEIVDLDFEVIGYLYEEDEEQIYVDKADFKEPFKVVARQIGCEEVFDKFVSQLESESYAHKVCRQGMRMFYNPTVLQGWKHEIEYGYVEVDLENRKCTYVIYRKLLRVSEVRSIDKFSTMKKVKGKWFSFEVSDKDETQTVRVILDVANNKQIIEGGV